MHIGVEARECGVELARETQVVDDLPVEALARNQQRNTGRVRRQQAGGDAAFQRVDRHALGLAVRDVGKGVAGLHGRLQVRQVHLGHQARDVALGVHLVDLLAQVAQAQAFITRVRSAELGQDAPQRRIAVVVVLELLQRGQQRVPAALGDADGEHDEERVQARLFDHHAVLGQELGDDGGRDAGLGELARQPQPRRDQRALDRVQQVEAVGQVSETVPAVAGLQHPVFAAAHAFGRQPVRAPDLEPPVLAELLVHLAHRAAEVQRLEDAFFHQRRAARRFHHGRRHVAAGDDGVLRAGAGVHQVGLVEEVAVQLALGGVLHEHLAGLADARQQLVRALRGKHQLVLGARPVLAHRVKAAIEAVKSGVRQPGFVEVQRVDVAIQLVLDGLGVVQNAVVGALRQRQDARAHRGGIHTRQQGVDRDLLADGLWRELALRDRADDAVVVARGRQEHRHRASHDDAVQDALVAVAVDHHHVARRHGVVPDHLVGRGRAVGDEETVVGVEDARRVALALRHRTGVVEQLAEFFDAVADVGAQHVLAEELVEHLPHRALQERHAAAVARAMPRIRAVLRVVHQRLEERRRQPVQVALGLADDVARHELGRVLEHVDEAVQLAQDVVGDVLAGARLAVDVDGDVGVLEADLFDELAQVQHRRVKFRAGRELLVVDAQDEGTGAALLLRELAEVAVAGGAQDLEALFLDGLGQRADAEARGVLGAEVFVDDDDGEAKTQHGGPVGVGIGWEGRGETTAKCRVPVWHGIPQGPTGYTRATRVVDRRPRWTGTRPRCGG